MRYLHELAVRLLDYNGTPVASISQIPSINREVYDSICSALGTVYEKAPGLFQQSHDSGLLYPPLTGTGNCDTFFLLTTGSFSVRNALCTVRIAGSEPDHTVKNYAISDGTDYAALISPSTTAAPSLTTGFTAYHDAFVVPSSRRVVGTVSINNQPLIRVADRAQAREKRGAFAPQYEVGTPLYWWEDIIAPRLDGFDEFATPVLVTTAHSCVICFYPMPEVLTGFTYESLWEPASLTDLSTLFSDASPVSLGLSFDVAREILLPLAVKEYTAKATFSNQRLVPAIDSAFQRATNKLLGLGPKDGQMKNW